MVARYLAPNDLDKALTLAGSGSLSIVAGGTDYFPARKSGSAPSDILDLSRVDILKGIHCTEDGWTRIGAATSWTEIIRTDLPASFRALQQAAREVGSVQIQNAGTIGGNLCNASPAADGVPPLLILDAEVEIASRAGSRRMPLSEFISGVRQTALRPGELLVAVHVPPQPQRCCTAFEKLGARRFLVISIAMTAVLVELNRQGWIKTARIAVGSCSAVAQRLPDIEAQLVGQAPGAIRIDESHLTVLSPITDVRADAAYRLEAVIEQIRRGIAQGAAAHE